MKKLLVDLINFFNKKKKFLNEKNIYLHEPSFNSLEKKYVNQCIREGFLSSVGKKIELFEKKLSKFCDSKFVISTINGTSALHLALKVVGVKRNNEVLLPTVSFISTANSILYEGAIPHFVDVEVQNFCIDHVKLERYLNKICIIKKGKCYNKKSKRIISALMVVHVFGHAAKMNELKKIAKKFKLKLIEDAAEALGSYYKKKHLGTIGDVGILSFNGNKIITTGGGGVILTKNKNYAHKAKSLSTNSKVKHRWEYIHDEIGYNYRMPNINAAIGLAQLSKIKSFLRKKRKIYYEYKSFFKSQADVRFLEEPLFCRSNNWLNAIVLNTNLKNKRDYLIKKLHKKKIFVRPVWKLLHKQNHLKMYPKMNLKNANDIENRIINLPSSANLIK